MRSNRSSFARITHLTIGAMILTLFLGNGAIAQRIGTIDAGTTITVRTTRSSTKRTATAECFRGVVDQDVRTATVRSPFLVDPTLNWSLRKPQTVR